MQIQAWSTSPSSKSNPWAPNSTLYPFLELEARNVFLSLNFSQLDFVKPSSGFHPVTWERVKIPTIHVSYTFNYLALLQCNLVEHPIVDIWEDLDTLRFLQHGEYPPQVTSTHQDHIQ